MTGIRASLLALLAAASLAAQDFICNNVSEPQSLDPALEWNTYLDTRQKTHDFTLVRAAWLADYPDPSNYLDMFRTKAGANDGFYSNPQYDRLLQRASTMPAGDGRNQVLQQAEAILVDQDQAVIPFFFSSNKFLLDDRKWGGIHPNTIDIHHPRWWFRK